MLKMHTYQSLCNYVNCLEIIVHENKSINFKAITSVNKSYEIHNRIEPQD